MTRGVLFLLAVLTLATVLLLLLAGCGGQDTPVEQAEEEAGFEEVAEEETTAPYQSPPASGREVEEAHWRRVIAAYENGGNATLVECQLAKLYLDVGPEEAQRVVDVFGDRLAADIEESGEVSADRQTLPDYLAELGYTC